MPKASQDRHLTISSTAIQEDTAANQDSPDALSLDMGPDIKRAVLKDKDLLNRVLTTKIVGYYFGLGLIMCMMLTALGCLIAGYDNPIWPMIITYVMGSLPVKDKVGKYVKKAARNLGSTGTEGTAANSGT